MKNLIKSISLVFLCLTVLVSLTLGAFAHSGRTDAYGGHKTIKTQVV